MTSMKLCIDQVSIPKSCIIETEEFCRHKGEDGFEARVYWIGKQYANNKASITRVFIPKQVARKSNFGVSVEIPEEANLELIGGLREDELALIKLHTHPRKAYLSETDIANPFFRHEGAISIVIPNFCNEPLSDLTRCNVNIFHLGKWQSLTSQQIKAFFRIGE